MAVYYRSAMEAIRAFGDKAVYMIKMGDVVIGTPKLEKNQSLSVDSEGMYTIITNTHQQQETEEIVNSKFQIIKSRLFVLFSSRSGQ